ncbi:MAG: AAA family ATPase [Pseudomonadota bacterium]
MVMLHELPCKPDRAAMETMVEALFNAAPRGLVELAWTSPKAPHALNGAQLYELDELDELIDRAVQLNETPNRNVYLSAGLRREDSVRDRRGEDDAVFAVSAIKADFDDPGTLDDALVRLDEVNLSPSLVVSTGEHPHARGQVWWVLEEPEADLLAVQTLEKDIARWLHGDRSITNASRVMRVAGSVAWPLKKGRKLEMTAVVERAIRPVPYPLEWLQNVVREHAPMTASAGADILDFNAADPQPLELADYIAAAAEPGAWHTNVLRAIAHMISRGTPPDIVLELLAPAVQQPGYDLETTRGDLIPMIEGALKRGFAPDVVEPLGDPQTPADEAETPVIPVLNITELADVEPPTWMVDGYVIEHGVSMLYAPPASYKSFIALDLALSVAHGVSWRNNVVKPSSVCYLAAEGKSGVFARVMAWSQHRGADGLAQPFRVIPTAINLLDLKQVALLEQRLLSLVEPPKLLVVDTLARCSLGGDENSATDAGKIMAAAQHLADAMHGHVMLVHHSGKDDAKGARGSSAFRGAVDTELRLIRDGDTVWLHVDKHKDAEEPKPAAFEMVAVEGLHPRTGEVLGSLVPVLSEAGVSAQTRAGKRRIGSNERRVLRFLEQHVEAPAYMIADNLRVDRSNLNKLLKRLVEAGLVEKDGDDPAYFKLPHEMTSEGQ